MSRRSTGLSREERSGVRASDELQAFSVECFARRNSISRAKAFQELASGRLEGRKCGSRTIITLEAERAWQRSLPKLIPSNPDLSHHSRKQPAPDAPRGAIVKAQHKGSPRPRKTRKKPKPGGVDAVE
jgi:hypothetical protein